MIKKNKKKKKERKKKRKHTGIKEVHIISSDSIKEATKDEDLGANHTGRVVVPLGRRGASELDG